MMNGTNGKEDREKDEIVDSQSYTITTEVTGEEENFESSDGRSGSFLFAHKRGREVKSRTEKTVSSDNLMDEDLFAHKRGRGRKSVKEDTVCNDNLIDEDLFAHKRGLERRSVKRETVISENLIDEDLLAYKRGRESKASARRRVIENDIVDDEAKYSSDDSSTILRPGAFAVPGIVVRSIPTQVGTTSSLANNGRDPVFQLSAFPFLDEDPISHRFRELELAKQAVEERQLKLEETLAENRMHRAGTVSGVAIEMIDEGVSGERLPRRRLFLSVLFGIVVIVSVTAGAILSTMPENPTPRKSGYKSAAPSWAPTFRLSLRKCRSLLIA